MSCMKYDNCTIYVSVEHMRLGPAGNRPVKATKQKLFITNGMDTQLTGLALIFSRPSPHKAVTDMNIANVSTDSSSFCENSIINSSF